MRAATLILGLALLGLRSRGAEARPVEADDTLLELVSRALGGKDKDKVDAVSLVLELLAEMDLQSLCKELNNDVREPPSGSHVTAIPKPLAHGDRKTGTMDTREAEAVTRKESVGDAAATTNSPDDLNHFSNSHDNGIVRKLNSNIVKNLKLQKRKPSSSSYQAPLPRHLQHLPRQLEHLLLTPESHQQAGPYRVYLPRGLEQAVVSSYDQYLSKFHPLPQEYTDHGSFLYPGDSNINSDIYDIDENLVYNLARAAAQAEEKEADRDHKIQMDGKLRNFDGNLRDFDGKLGDSDGQPDASAFFFPDGLMGFPTLTQEEKDYLDDVIIRGSQSLKSDTPLFSDSLKREDFPPESESVTSMGDEPAATTVNIPVFHDENPEYFETVASQSTPDAAQTTVPPAPSDTMTVTFDPLLLTSLARDISEESTNAEYGSAGVNVTFTEAILPLVPALPDTDYVIEGVKAREKDVTNLVSEDKMSSDLSDEGAQTIENATVADAFLSQATSTVTSTTLLSKQDSNVTVTESAKDLNISSANSLTNSADQKNGAQVADATDISSFNINSTTNNFPLDIASSVALSSVAINDSLPAAATATIIATSALRITIEPSLSLEDLDAMEQEENNTALDKATQLIEIGASGDGENIENALINMQVEQVKAAEMTVGINLQSLMSSSDFPDSSLSPTSAPSLQLSSTALQSDDKGEPGFDASEDVLNKELNRIQELSVPTNGTAAYNSPPDNSSSSNNTSKANLPIDSFNLIESAITAQETIDTSYQAEEVKFDRKDNETEQAAYVMSSQASGMVSSLKVDQSMPTHVDLLSEDNKLMPDNFTSGVSLPSIQSSSQAEDQTNILSTDENSIANEITSITIVTPASTTPEFYQAVKKATNQSDFAMPSGSPLNVSDQKYAEIKGYGDIESKSFVSISPKSEPDGLSQPSKDSFKKELGRGGEDVHDKFGKESEKENEVETDFEPELQWWRPIESRNHHHKELVQEAGLDEEFLPRNNDILLDTFSPWSGKEVEDSWSKGKLNLKAINAAAAAEKPHHLRKGKEPRQNTRVYPTHDVQDDEDRNAFSVAKALWQRKRGLQDFQNYLKSYKVMDLSANNQKWSDVFRRAKYVNFKSHDMDKSINKDTKVENKEKSEDNETEQEGQRSTLLNVSPEKSSPFKSHARLHNIFNVPVAFRSNTVDSIDAQTHSMGKVDSAIKRVEDVAGIDEEVPEIVNPVDDSLTGSSSKDDQSKVSLSGEATSKPESSKSAFVYHPYPNTMSKPWSPFNPELVSAKTGTLWGLKPDPRSRRLDLSHFIRYQQQQKQKKQLGGLNWKKNGFNAGSAAPDATQVRTQDDSSLADVRSKKDSRVDEKAFSDLELQQKTIWSESAATGEEQSRRRYNGYSCPGLFGYFPDSTDCHNFFICSWGIPYRFHCPAGLLWNPEDSVCDWSRNVECSSVAVER